jgi:hypothetical protein
LRGLYLKNLKDFDEELEDMSTNMTLLKRIQNRMLNLTDQPSLITATNDVSQELLTDRHPIEEETKS